VLRKIDRYEVLDELGHGGMATVYRARDTKLDRLVALKVMHPHLRGAKEARDRFRREAQSVARLAHPRILEIYDYSGEESEESYIAGQLLTGPTLRAWGEAHAPIPAEIVACIGIELAGALAAAHDKGIVHRDVKPENILLHEDRELKLTDFGIAAMVDSHSMTATGQILGSPGHMAPEQIEGGDADGRTDLFALGTVLYFLATGRLPFVGKNPHQILKRVVDGEHPDPLRLEPRMGGALRAVLERLLATRPGDRPPNARALIEELRAFALRLGIEDPAAEVARFLAAPDAQTQAVHARVVERYTALGKEAKERGALPEANDCFARVLAIDDGNPEVLALVVEIGKARQRSGSRGPLLAAAVIGALGLAALGLRAFPGSAAPLAPDAGPRTGAGADAGLEPPLDTGADTGVDAPADAASPALPDASATVVITEAVRRVAVPRLPRHVTFDINPVNAMVSIDGAPPVSTSAILGRGMDLAIGRHTISVQSGTSCCLDETFSIEVAAGEGDQHVRLVLRSRPASLLVRGPAGLRVEVVGRARGGRELFEVPMEARTEALTVRAGAPGHDDAEAELRFRAGELTEWTATLRPRVEPPAP